VPSELSMYYFI